MNSRQRRTLAAEERQIKRRLGRAVRVNDDGPVLSATTLSYEGRIPDFPEQCVGKGGL